MRWWLLLLALSLSPANAEPEHRLAPWYLGGGFGRVSIDELPDERDTKQFLLGFRWTDSAGLAASRFHKALEVGYLDTTNYPRDGKWMSLLLGYSIIDEMELLLRAGIENGHSISPYGGIGFGLWFDRNLQFRLEYLEREEAHELQFLMVVHPWRGAR